MNRDYNRKRACRSVVEYQSSFCRAGMVLRELCLIDPQMAGNMQVRFESARNDTDESRVAFVFTNSAEKMYYYEVHPDSVNSTPPAILAAEIMDGWESL